MKSFLFLVVFLFGLQGISQEKNFSISYNTSLTIGIGNLDQVRLGYFLDEDSLFSVYYQLPSFRDQKKIIDDEEEEGEKEGDSNHTVGVTYRHHITSYKSKNFISKGSSLVPVVEGGVFVNKYDTTDVEHNFFTKDEVTKYTAFAVIASAGVGFTWQINPFLSVTAGLVAAAVLKDTRKKDSVVGAFTSVPFAIAMDRFEISYHF